MNVAKVGKWSSIIASDASNFISKLLKGDKNMVFFAQLHEYFHGLFCVGSLDCG